MGDSLKSVAGNYMRRKEGRKRRTIKKVLLFFDRRSCDEIGF